jgi:hypothetical protein
MNEKIEKEIKTNIVHKIYDSSSEMKNLKIEERTKLIKFQAQLLD